MSLLLPGPRRGRSGEVQRRGRYLQHDRSAAEVETPRPRGEGGGASIPIRWPRPADAREVPARHAPRPARPPDACRPLAERRQRAGAPLPALPRLLAPPQLLGEAPGPGAALRALQPRYRPAADAQVQPRGAARHAEAAGGADGRAPGAGQLHAHRSRRLPHHPDQGFPLRPRPAGRHRRLRGDPDLLSRRHHHHRAAPRHQEGLHGLEGGEGAGVPAALHPLQAQAVRRARRGGDAGEEGGPEGGREHRAPAAQDAARHGHQRLRLHQAVQEHPAQRRGDGVPQHQRALPHVRQDQVRRDRGQRLRRGRGQHRRQDRAAEQSLHAGDDAGGPRRHRRAPGQQLHQSAQPLHGGAGAQPLFPLHGGQPRA